jgi:hypothetical protein
MSKHFKKGVIVFHANIREIYKPAWIRKSIESMMDQTRSDLTYYEINYEGDDYSVLENYKCEKKFWSIKLSNHAHAMNFILDRAFEDCDIVFNTNLDDYYHPQRVERQIEAMQQGYHLVSTDFCYIEEKEIGDVVTRMMNIPHQGDIGYNFFMKNNNIIAHPSVCMNKEFWRTNKYDASLVPQEDFDLWKRAYQLGYKIHIIPQVLLYYRIHPKQVGRTLKTDGK